MDGPRPVATASRRAAIEIRDAVPAEDALARMALEIRESLGSVDPWIPSKYFYDDRGSALFEAITKLPEYYPTRTEAQILEERADEVADDVKPVELFELGSGSGVKTRRLVAAGLAAGSLEALTFFDVHRGSLEASLAAHGTESPRLRLLGYVGDFERHLGAVPPRDGRLAVFLGGTIGNLHPDTEVPRLLRDVAGRLGKGGAFLLGVDLEKDVGELEAAYNDPGGVTAEFNRNILRVVNDRMGADFMPERFGHVAFYDRERCWIEMRLRATAPCRVRVPKAGLDLAFRAGDEIRTEISCKYTRASLERRLVGSGLELVRWIPDAKERFGLALLAPVGERRP